MNKVKIIICTEKGELAKKSILFVKSLRRFGGKLKDVDILSFSPRRNYIPSRRTLDILEKDGVTNILDELNVKYSDYGHGNKPQICAFAEANFDSDTFAFFDSDQMVIREPSTLLMEDGYDTSMLPEFGSNVASNGSDDLADFWENLFSKFNVQNPQKVNTVITDEEVHGYWNVGLVPIVSGKNIYQEWNEVFNRMMIDKMFPKGIITFTDQVSYSIAIQKMNLKIGRLPKGYNYPIQAHNRLKLDNKLKSYREATTLHYTASFRSPFRKQNNLFSFLKDHPDNDWFLEQFKVLELYPRPLIYKLSYFLKLYKNKIIGKIGLK